MTTTLRPTPIRQKHRRQVSKPKVDISKLPYDESIKSKYQQELSRAIKDLTNQTLEEKPPQDALDKLQQAIYQPKHLWEP
jgi:hypothetical protein